MTKLSMTNHDITFPQTYEDIQAMLQLIREGQTDDDLFSFNETSSGRSYCFYGTKVFQFQPKRSDKIPSKMKVEADVLDSMGQSVSKPMASNFYRISIDTTDEMIKLIDILKAKKRMLFRNLITETFGCCNDFICCSDAKECIHQDDRFYNGCTYRTNLENGLIFYGNNCNIK